MKLHVTAEVGKAFVPFVRKHVSAAFKVLQSQSRSRLWLNDLTIALVADRRMTELHDQFMGLPTTTDVLTFPIDEHDAREGRVVLCGEVYVCVPEARRQAHTRKIEPKLEVLLYAIHGMLHLLGYDDRTDRAYRIMHRKEDAILEELGFGPVFAPKATVKPRRERNRRPRRTRSVALSRGGRS